MARHKKAVPYWGWIVGACIAWAIVLLVVWQNTTAARFHNVLIFFGGFALGVIEASIAREVVKRS